jgi:hypothetical protein
MKRLSTFIRNKKLPICINCLHFIEHKNNYPYDPNPSDHLYGKCKQFGEVNIITGIFQYEYARLCRDNSNKCGKFGSQYTPKH